MRIGTIVCLLILFVAVLSLLYISTGDDLDSQDPLPSWNEGATKSAILDFVTNTTNQSHPDYVDPEERIATFDNDGTLWCEYPDYVQSMFMFDRVRDMAPQHPEWNSTEPFRSIISGERQASANFSVNESLQIYVATSTNLTSEEYMGLTREWLNTSCHPRFGQPYTKCVYKPMLELLRYLQAEGFKAYIVSGGDEDFVRSFSDEVYGIPPEQVIGSAFRLQFVENNSSVSVVKLPQILVVDDGQEKAKEIVQNIGQRPNLAYGNSNGDIPMLQFTTSDGRHGLGLLNHHDDPMREYAYDRGSAIGGLDSGLDMADEWGWQIVSMKEDWKEIF